MKIREILEHLANKENLKRGLYKLNDVDHWLEVKLKNKSIFDINIYRNEDNNKLCACAYDVVNGNTLTDHWLELSIDISNEIEYKSPVLI